MTDSLMFKQIGEFKYYTSCRFCCRPNLKPVINLGYVPLAGGFIKGAEIKNSKRTEKFYPLELCFCENCYLLQTNAVINPDKLFKDYFYHSSAIKTLTDHFQSLAKELRETLETPPNHLIVEIGCNDGVLISALLKNGFKAIGVDPAKNIVSPLIKKGLPILNEYFTQKTAKKIIERSGKASAIISTNTLAHIEDMHEVIKGIKLLLKKDGFLAFEVHYLGDLIKGLQYDMIYHEHQYYYSLLALMRFFSRHDMEIYDLKSVPIHRGSMRYYVQNRQSGAHKVTEAVKNLRQKERKQGLDKITTYKRFSSRVIRAKRDLLKLLRKIKSENKTIVGYGASGRGTMIMNYCGLGKDLLDYVVDDAPAKHGAFTPGTHHLIYPSSMLDGKKKPDYAVLFAWPFIEEIKKRKKDYLKNGGKFIVPLPKVKVVARLPSNG